LSLFQQHVDKCLGGGSRVAQIIERLERGEEISQTEINRAKTLQALDLAHAGELFVLEQVQLEAQVDEQIFGKWLGNQQG